MKVVPKFKLEISLSWKTPCTSCSWQLAKINDSFLYGLSLGLNYLAQ
jgi:hypothetical protein